MLLQKMLITNLPEGGATGEAGLRNSEVPGHSKHQPFLGRKIDAGPPASTLLANGVPR